MTSQPSQAVPLCHFSQPVWEVLRYHRFHSDTCSQTLGTEGAPARRYHMKARPNRDKTKGLGFDARRVNVAFHAEVVASWTCGSFLEDVSYLIRNVSWRKIKEEAFWMRGETCSRKLLRVQLPPTPAAENVVLTSIGTLNELHTEIRSPVQSGDAVGASGWENNRWEGLCVFSRVLELL